MRRIQFSLTVSEGKWLIAHAIADMKEVRDAIAGGSPAKSGERTRRSDNAHTRWNNFM